ncbi:hypothetical protein BsWGS_12378 [Bradybaena similaris]
MSALLKGKGAIVTGASSRVGEAIDIMFASQGSKMTLFGRNEDRLKPVFDKTAKASDGQQDRFLTVQGDLKDSKARKNILSKIVEKFGGLDILVANAGIIQKNECILVATEEMCNDILNSNLQSVFFLIQEASPHPHPEKSQRSVINISSATTNMAIPNPTITLMSKVALDHLTRCLAVELRENGILVKSVNHGIFPTRIQRHVDADTDKLNSAFGNLVLDN